MEIQDEKPVEDQSIDQEVAEQNVDIGDATIPTKLFDSRKEAEKAGDSEDPEDEDQYVAGLKLWTLMASLTLVMFLMMLDMSIIVTVCTVVPSAPEAGLIGFRRFLESRAIFTPSAMLAGTAVRT